MEPTEHAEHIRSLHELVTGSSDITGILEGVTVFASKAMSEAAGAPIDCALTLRRRKRTATVAGSSEKAVALDRIEQSLGHGPCLDALNAGELRLLADVATDVSWPEFSKVLAAEGCASVLGVPLELGETSEAVLNFFATQPGLFTAEVIAEAAAFADVAGSTLRLAIRIESVERLNEDLKAAMASRKDIDMACGVLMAQSECSPEKAFEILKKASSSRNEKLHAVAAEIVSRYTEKGHTPLQFED